MMSGRLEGVSLVSVVIPAFNAERTIDRTLASVRAQSHRELEILVVNDGSVDSTAERVRRHAAEDGRIRLIEQANGGVAAARNRGVTESRSDFVAPVDADDLWHPHKIARQLPILQTRPEIGLVATAYAVIDEEDGIVAEIGGTMPDGVGFEDLCRRNFIGNGSSALMRRALVDRVGGYDGSLRARGGQGCEDLQLYLEIAERSGLAFISEPLTAYRRGRSSMSGDGHQMLRSFDLVSERFCARRPELRPAFRAHRVFMLCWLIHNALRSGDLRHSAALGGQLLRTRSAALPKAVAAALARQSAWALKRLRRGRDRRPALCWSGEAAQAKVLMPRTAP
jgi:glycosyltransferase involved in cell wall biosynthesis